MLSTYSCPRPGSAPNLNYILKTSKFITNITKKGIYRILIILKNTVEVHICNKPRKNIFVENVQYCIQSMSVF